MTDIYCPQCGAWPLRDWFGTEEYACFKCPWKSTAIWLGREPPCFRYRWRWPIRIVILAAILSGWVTGCSSPEGTFQCGRAADAARDVHYVLSGSWLLTLEDCYDGE